MMAKLDRFHGQASGVFTGDEVLAGRSPIQGTELCAVVEYAYSLEVLASLFGDPRLADRLERILFNALPATFSPDMWSHQYDQQSNQVECSVREGRPWRANGPESNIFGLEPNYGCCTANLSQGWPKFAAHLWMGASDGGLAAVAWSPCRLEATLGGEPVTVETETDYPFRDRVRVTVTAARRTRGPLLLRIPEWASGATVQVGGGPREDAAAGTFHRVDRAWEGRTDITLVFPMEASLWRGDRGSAAIVRGPLVYALRLGEDWRRINPSKPGRELPHGDWEVYPTTPWNYGLTVSDPLAPNELRFQEHPVGDLPFSPAGAPVTAIARARRIPGWTAENGSAREVPQGPIQSSEPIEEITLIPYGCTTCGSPSSRSWRSRGHGLACVRERPGHSAGRSGTARRGQSGARA